MSASGLPFDDFRELIRNLPGPDLGAERAVREREVTLTKPAGSLGRLEDIAAWLAAWTGKRTPQINRPLVAVFAGNHGVTAKNITPFPSSVTAQMVENFAAGGAAINGEQRILDIQPEKLHQRVSVILGSKNEVERVGRYHAEAK